MESVTEEVHTHDLLYPSNSALLDAQHNLASLGYLDPASAASAANSFDDGGDMRLPVSGIRIIVAQDGNSISQQPRILFDSLPQPEALSSSPADEGGRGSGEKQSRGDVAAGRWQHKRGSSLNERSENTPEQIDWSPTAPQEGSKGAFGNSRPRSKGGASIVHEGESSFLKLHRERREETDTLLGCMFGSTGLSMLTSTKVHINPGRSEYNSENAGSHLKLYGSGLDRLGSGYRTQLKRSMTVEQLNGMTRSSYMPGKSGNRSACNGTSVLITRVFSVDKPVSTPSPTEAGPDSRSFTPLGDEKIKQIKLPRYCVALVLQFPRSRHALVTNSSLGRSVPASFGGHSSVNLDENIAEHEIERLMTHWNNLTRGLTSLEVVAQQQIQQLVSESYRAYSGVQKAVSGNAGSKKFKQPSRRTMQLPELALQQVPAIWRAAELIQSNVGLALSIRRVITGQTRWGIWREEARWISRWTRSKEQEFLSMVMSAFLGNHAGCLGWTGIDRFGERDKATTATLIKHRTVIVCAEKMVARRFVFLLSAFLPSTMFGSGSNKFERFVSRYKSGLSDSSPPAAAPLSRQVSLRRTIKRGPLGRAGSHIRTHERSISISTPDSPVDDETPHRLPGHARRSSDTRSIRSLALPIPHNNAHARKSSISTDPSTLTTTDIPVPHFSTSISDRPGTTPTPRPGSSGSVASLSLQRTLSRSDSSELSPVSPSASRWGSMLSGFWGGRRGSSTEGTEATHDGLGITGMSYSTSPRSPSKLARMVEEAAPYSTASTNETDHNTTQGPPSPEKISTTTPARDIPERPKTDECPLKLSIDAKDGVIDIALPPSSSQPSSYGSSAGLPHELTSTSSSFNDKSTVHRRRPPTSNAPINNSESIEVAGWLRRYHPDFALQAVRPYQTVQEDVKDSMKMEPNGHTYTTVLVDTKTFTISRLTLTYEADRAQDGVFSEQDITGCDPILTAAMQKVLGHSDLPNHSPCASSPARHCSIPALPDVPGRECKHVVMGALKEVAGRVLDDFEQGRTNPSPSILEQGIRQWLEENKV